MTEAVMKSMDWFLYDNDLRHERVKHNFEVSIHKYQNQPPKDWHSTMSTTNGQTDTANGRTSTSGQASTKSYQTICASTTSDKTGSAIKINLY